MKDMKLSPSERIGSAPTILEDSEYPYGLRFSLDEDSLQKISFPSMPGVGDEMIVTARVKVTDVSANETESGVNRHLGLQITDMEFGPDKKDDEKEEGASSEDTARKLYGDQNTVMPTSNGKLYH